MEKQTLVEHKMKEEIQEIYQILTRYGYHGIVGKPLLQNIHEMQKHLSDFFEPTPQRQNLIEWLISQTYPLYQSDHKNKSKKIATALWKLGVMPLSKHTKNLDYDKYIAGLLGQENSINLIYNLCLLLKENTQMVRAKEDTTFNLFFQELLNSFDSLINIDYDPYKISFPQCYQHLSEEDFNAEWEEFTQKLKKNNLVSGQSKESAEYQQIFREFDQNKQEFKRAYEALIQKVSLTIEKNKHLIENEKLIKQPQSKVLKISPSLTKKYKQYRAKIGIVRLRQSQLKEQRLAIWKVIEEINDVVDF